MSQHKRGLIKNCDCDVGYRLPNSLEVASRLGTARRGVTSLAFTPKVTECRTYFYL